MPIVAHSKLPTFERLRNEGHEVLEARRALGQDIRELHIGLLNMMPDAALEATERQFMRLIGSSNRIAQFHVHPFSIDGVDREGAAKAHVEAHYEDFELLQRLGLDALIITGANVTQADITLEPFWNAMIEVMDWARENVCSTLCSCLASHAAFRYYHDLVRTHLEEKQWGVYEHRVVDVDHPILANVNTRFDAPHSRFNDVPREHMELAGLRVLVESHDAGVHLAVSEDGFRSVYFQGHPEYDIHSLLKEYKREIARFLGDRRGTYPPVPDNYFNPEAESLLAAFRDAVIAAKATGSGPPRFPEEALRPHLDNTWSDTGKAMFNNWLGLVYQLTDSDRRKPFMDGIDPADPLGLGDALHPGSRSTG